MLIIFKELTNNFEQSLLDSLKKNNKEREFEILRKNLISLMEINLIKIKNSWKYMDLQKVYSLVKGSA